MFYNIKKVVLFLKLVTSLLLVRNYGKRKLKRWPAIRCTHFHNLKHEELRIDLKVSYVLFFILRTKFNFPMSQSKEYVNLSSKVLCSFI